MQSNRASGYPGHRRRRTFPAPNWNYCSLAKRQRALHLETLECRLLPLAPTDWPTSACSQIPLQLRISEPVEIVCSFTPRFDTFCYQPGMTANHASLLRNDRFDLRSLRLQLSFHLAVCLRAWSVCVANRASVSLPRTFFARFEVAWQWGGSHSRTSISASPSNFGYVTATTRPAASSPAPDQLTTLVLSTAAWSRSTGRRKMVTRAPLTLG